MQHIKLATAQPISKDGPAQRNWKAQPPMVKMATESECKRFDRLFYRLKSSQVNSVVRFRTYLAAAEMFESELSPEDWGIIPDVCGGGVYLEEFNGC
jgi:hypothetical protein